VDSTIHESPVPKTHVLIVEDERDIASLIKHTLERGGDTHAEVARTGDAAIRAVTDRTPDLVILDLNLPVLSGTDVCRHARRGWVANRNRVLSRDRLLERVWGYDRAIETRSVDVHVGRLRSKLGPAGRQIETVVGLGYRFVE